MAGSHGKIPTMFKRYHSTTEELKDAAKRRSFDTLNCFI